MPSLTARLIKAFSRRMIRRENLEQDDLIRHLRKTFNHTPGLTLLPRGIRLRTLETPGFSGDLVTAERPGMTVLYIHGGAYIAGVTRTYHNLAGRLARDLNAAVYLVRYPFAPESPFPGAVNRCIEAYEWLLADGHAPDDIAIGGDSAGGGLTLALLLAIRDRGLPRPRCGFTFSPAGDGHCRGPSIDANNPSDCMLSASMVRTVADIYMGDADRNNPYASPCLGDYTGLPPLMITAATDECLYSDAEAIRARAEAAGVPVTWVAREGLFHVWPILLPWLPEAREDVRKVVDFIRAQK